VAGDGKADARRSAGDERPPAGDRRAGKTAVPHHRDPPPNDLQLPKCAIDYPRRSIAPIPSDDLPNDRSLGRIIGATLKLSTGMKNAGSMSSVLSEGATETALLPTRSTADGTLRRLLEEATLQFGERGFHGVSVRDIAEAVGIRPSSMYAHLESKEQLLLELMLLGHEEHNYCLRQARDGARIDPASRMRAIVHAHVFFHGQFPVLARVCNRELHALSEVNLERVIKVRLDSENVILDVIQAGVKARVFRPRDAWLGVAAIGAMGIRVAEWWPQGRGYSLEDVADTYAEFAIKILT